MDFETLLAALPSGLHDAALLSLTFDLAEAEVHCVVDVDVSAPSDPSSEGRSRRARLTFSGVTCFVVDPPAIEPSPSAGATLIATWIDAGAGSPGTAPLDAMRAPDGGFLAWFYRHEVNGFVRIGARDASIAWLDELPRSPLDSPAGDS